MSESGRVVFPSVSFPSFAKPTAGARVFRGLLVSRSASAISVYFVVASLALAQSGPQLINYQGRVTDEHGAPLTNGLYSMSVSIYTDDVTTARIWGPQKWGEGAEGPGSASAKVPVVDGYFSLVLGPEDVNSNALAAAFVHTSTWVEVACEGVTGARQQILSVPYAMQAEHAGSRATGQVVNVGGAQTDVVTVSRARLVAYEL
jgi:hypothetical protein